MLRRPWSALVLVASCTPVLLTCASVQVPYTDGSRLILSDTGTTWQGNPVPVECPAGTHGGGVHPHAAEFDDCQRLTVGASHFSSLIGVRALSRTTTGDLTPYDGQFGVAVAQLYNFSSFEFLPLRVQPKYSCVYLRRQGGNAWQGRIVAMEEETRCPQPNSSTWTGPVLPAARDAGSNNPADYPAVARWEWTPAAGNGAIGVHCGAGWCEIGPGAGTAPAPPGTVKGWGDVQLLAEEVPGGLLPRVPASITPAARLDTLEQRHFTCPGACTDTTAAWVHVADVVLMAPSEFYREKMNFDSVGAPNRIYLRYKPTHRTHRWQTMIISARGVRSYHVTHFTPQPDGQVPPVARFRWRSEDDTTWVRCSLGCCESSGSRIAAVDL